MNRKNVTYLSLGSNVGNKKGYIRQALQYIEEYIGEVVQESHYYVSEAWGFESDDFLNSVIEVKTLFDPLQLLNRIKMIENTIGAYHNSLLEGYHARKIDIDIIYYNNFIYKQKLLKIPHVHMQNRKFVLLPFLDLNSTLKHPVFNKNIEELIILCNDKSKVYLYEE